VERFFRPGYAAHLVAEWIPALEKGVKQKLEHGARVADVGCSHGASTVLLAKAFPNSTFSRFDYHEPSLVRARELARQGGVAEQIAFERATAKEFSGTYDLVTFFDCLHDIGDPVGVVACQVGLETGGDLDRGRTFCWRPNCRQPQSDRPNFLCSVDADLRARIIVSGSRSCARYSGRRQSYGRQ
jgi:2-polyprenyl-3-methyl-5-hydroxy-6-metoxy-1,4-benzoquinol methylase